MADLIKSDSNRAADATDDAGTASAMPVQPLKASTAPLRRASSGSVQEFVEVDGTTTFAAPPAPTYRYKLSLRSGLLRVWIEDCKSKKQWCTSDLAVDSYVDINNAVPGAVAADYVECFRTLLNRAVEGADEMPRAFKRTKGNAFRLDISMKVQVLTRMRVATYSFDLEPISVERIDVLEARMRDLQEEMKALRVKTGASAAVGELQETVKNLLADLSCYQANENTAKVKLQETVKKLQAELSCRQAEILDLRSKIKKPPTIEATATTATGNVICWSATGNYTNGKDGIIQNLEPGRYVVTAVVHYNGLAGSGTVRLMKGDRPIEGLYFNQPFSSGVVAHTMRVDKGDELRIVCTTDKVSTSYLTLTRVGS